MGLAIIQREVGARFQQALLFALSIAMRSPSPAQWPHVPDAKIPRTADGNGITRFQRQACRRLSATGAGRRRDFGHLETQMTIEEAKAYGKAWSATLPMNLLPDTDLLEFVCNENARDARHLNVE